LNFKQISLFNLDVDNRLSAWAAHRAHLDQSKTPLEDVWAFWKNAPFTPYNNKIDPFNRHGWPSPWEIIVDNKYDDFTKAIMIGFSLRLTNRFKNNIIYIRTLVDNTKNIAYNIVIVVEEWAINYSDNGPVSVEIIPDSFYLENHIEL